MTKQAIQLAMAGALAAGLALAQTPASAPQAAPTGTAAAKTHRGALRHRMVKALGLTDAQKQQAKAIFQETKTANQPIRAQLQQNRQALAAAVKANDIGQIRQLAQVQGTLRGQMMAARSEGMAKFYATLTPDQKAKAGQSLQNMRQRIAQKRSKG
jgi:Spy/CpxP family protein refolding chaperone